MPARAHTHNFAAGPSPLPTSVLEEAQGALLDFQGSGIGICEVSHRGKEFASVIKEAEAGVRALLQVPDTHHVLFTQGGGTTQFSAVVLNLLAHYAAAHPASNPPKMDYVVTGTWSKKAASEAARLAHAGKHAQVNLVADTKPSGYTRLPTRDEYSFSPAGEAAFVYYCENETINGVEFPGTTTESGAFPFDLVPEGTPLVADYSSSFLSRPIPNIEKHALIYAGAQKNLSPAGLVVVIVHKSILNFTDADAPIPIPELLVYKNMADSASLYNTPPVWPIYITSLVVRLLLANGGLQGKRDENLEKATLLYNTLEDSGNVVLKVEKEARSWMNVVWNMKGGEEAEKAFLAGAEERGLRQLKGHRSIGGIRASLYNAVTLESVQALVAWIKEFDSQVQN
ncbi:phosphoserine aminotransferase [Phaffia rhodozyma]|uniref:phosphoserine transaminase n=1 Tax=Phaffia rhodozyma TaxID=264483 RepID=A0A0F7SVW7_PHARH|nr:phosphoserine aminotransferase [Phaffia rhodozyma]